jgi:broad specificity phosphatase PhoE
MTEPRIVLVRHGRSAHVHAGWIDYAGFLRWRETYEAAGIDSRETPPPELQQVAASAGLLLASDTPRAVESARLLAAGAEVTVSPLLRELELTPPNLGRLRLPLAAWALAFGVRMLFHPHVTPAEQERARAVATWLAELAAQHGTIIVLTHHSFRSLLAKTLAAGGWHATLPRRRSSHWSLWLFAR